MLLDRPIPRALFYSHVRLEAKRNVLDALSRFGTDRTSTQAAAQDPLRKEGKLTALYRPDDKKGILPKEFGFYVVELRLSEPLIPPPSGYLVAMEGADNHIPGRLSPANSDDVIDQSGWIKIKYLEGNWLSFARSSTQVGQNTRILIKALPQWLGRRPISLLLGKTAPPSL